MVAHLSDVLVAEPKLLCDRPSSAARALAALALLPPLRRLPNDDRDDPFPSLLLMFPVAIALCKMLQLLPMGPASTGSAARSLQPLQPIGKTLVKHFRHLLSLLFDPLAAGSGCMRALALSCANQGVGGKRGQRLGLLPDSTCI